jgi:STE24 endopeptidase
LAQENLANLTPHPIYVWVHYSHPTIPQRLEAIHSYD